MINLIAINSKLGGTSYGLSIAHVTGEYGSLGVRSGSDNHADALKTTVVTSYFKSETGPVDVVCVDLPEARWRPQVG